MIEKAKQVVDLILNDSEWFTYQAYLEKMSDMYSSLKPVTKEQWDVIIECTGSKTMAYHHHLKDEAKMLLRKINKQLDQK